MNQPHILRRLRYPSDRVVDNIATMMPRIAAARQLAARQQQARHLTKPGRSATHFEEP